MLSDEQVLQLNSNFRCDKYIQPSTHAMILLLCRGIGITGSNRYVPQDHTPKADLHSASERPLQGLAAT